MKKRLLSMLMVVVLMAGMLAVPAFAANCSDADHASIDWDLEPWVSENNKHWKACPVDGCSYKYGKTVCADNDADGEGRCDDCDIRIAHNHEVTDPTAWAQLSGEENHEGMCGYCDVMLTEACVDADSDDACDVCGGAVAHKHVWSYVGTSGTETSYECACGETMTEHKHNYGDLQWDDYAHWRECKGCGDKIDFSAHIDGNGDGTCDSGCYHKGMDADGMVYKQLVITGLSTPSVGSKIDFTASASPSEFGNVYVKWNRVISLSNNTSTAMTEDNVYAAGMKYNVSLSVKVNKEATLSEDFAVTFNGVDVPFYKTDAEFNKALKAYDGTADVAAARLTKISNSNHVQICMMYAELGGVCNHEYVKMQGATTHWTECKLCGLLYGGYTKHFDKNANGICDNCGYDIYGTNTNSGSGSGHTHSWSADWVEDISNHWKQCSTCGAKSSIGAHVDANNTNKCDTCGYVMTAAVGHTHNFATTWTESAYQHWHECTCGAKNDIGAHVDKNNSGLCDDCGYAMNAALNAAAGGTTVSGGTGTVVPGTGDNNAMYLWMAALAASIMGLGGAVLTWRKRKES